MAYSAPYKKVWIEQPNGEQIDLSDYITSLKYSRDIEKENELSFSIEQAYIQKLTDSWPILRGGIIFVQFGYRGGERSSVFRCRVVEITRKYSTKVQMSVKCRDEGSVLKKSASGRVWKQVTTSDICKQIAAFYGLVFVGDDTTFVFQSFPQSQKDDWQFLQEVAKKDESGNYIVYIDSGKLYLERRGLDKPSDLSFIYGQGNRIISFETSVQEKTGGTASAASTEIAGFDPDKKEELKSEVKPGTEKDNIDLGDYKWVYSANGEEQSRPQGDGLLAGVLKEHRMGKKIVSPQTSGTEIQNEANFTKKQATLKQIIGTLKIVGEPTLVLNSIITIQGVLKEDEGNYLITAIEDDVSTGGYITTVKLLKNGGAKPTSTQKQVSNTALGEKVNNAKGWLTNNTKERVFVFDANGDKLNNPKTEYKPPK